MELDLHQSMQVDLGDRPLLKARSWPWLRRRVLGLVWEPGTRLQRSLKPELTPRSMYPPARDREKPTQ